MKSILLLRVLFALLFLLSPTLAYGDGFSRGTFQLSDAELENQYQFIAEYPASKSSEKLIAWPDGCSPVQTNQYQSNDGIIQTYLINCDAPLSSDDIITVPYKVDAAVFELQLGAWQSRVMGENSPDGFELVLQHGKTIGRALSDIATDYLNQGLVHIWLGWDHLAFVFCLCLLVTGLRYIFWTISAFTIGHSASMALSFFKLVAIPISPIEAIIALSIVLIAREAWQQTSYTKQANKAVRLRMLIVVILFGLIHGLGFASALENIGVGENERVPALIFFNLGVELGQITFVAITLALLVLLDKVQKKQFFRQGALLCVGSVASFWSIERIYSFNW